MSAWTGESSLRRAPGQNTATQFPDGKIATFAFDKVGRRTTMVDWGGTSTFSFDALGRQSGQTDAAGFVQAYGYDPNGNRTGLNLVGTGLFTYTFDSLNRLATAMKPGNALYTLMYDADSRRTTMMLGNGSTRQYAYDARSQLTTQVELNASSTPIVTLIDTYDAVGNRMTRGVNGTLSTWTYDDLYRLTGQMKPGQVATYTLDGVGNLKTMWEGADFPKTFTVDAADKIVTMVEGVDLTTYTYTGYGALASEITGNATTAYSYNGQDHLVGITDPNGVKSTYSFSGDGLRRAAQNGNVLPTTMVWDGPDYLYLDGPPADALVLTLGSEIVSCGDCDLLPDSLGSVIGDIRSGNDPLLLFEYYPYGKRANATVSGLPFLYVGSLGYFHDDASRIYVRARELYELLGRWMQVDPVWPMRRPVSYADSSPTSLRDPSGLLACGIMCPKELCAWYRKLCHNIMNFDQRRLDAVNKCMKKISWAVGKTCEALTWDYVKCMSDFCKRGKVTCYPMELGIPGQSGAAGYTYNDQCSWSPCRDIAIVIGSPGSPLDVPDYGFGAADSFRDCQFDHNGTPIRYDLSAFVFLHELGHACGIWHGHEGEPYDRQCNDILAYCLYGHMW